jgi:CYTH domain-containing protein
VAIEIERKFLIKGDAWRDQVRTKQRFRQAYLSTSDISSVRVRIADERQAWISIKTSYHGISRDEFEYPIPVADAHQLIQLRESEIIEKNRYTVAFAGLTWEIDEFAGSSAGLIIAEVELEDEVQAVALPKWIGREVTGERRYQNSQLAQHPFRAWRTEVAQD